MTVTARGAEGSKITADEERVVIERSGIFARIRQGSVTVTFMRDITGAYIHEAQLGFRGFIQILVGGETPTTWVGANQNPRCMYFNASDEDEVRPVADFVNARATPVRPIPGTGLDTTGVIIGAPPTGTPEGHTAKPVILAITSNPVIHPDRTHPDDVQRPLDLDDEINRMRDALEGSPHGRDFELQDRPAARMDELVGDLLEYPPTILHFSGHGVPAGLILTDADGQKPVLANPVALAHMLLIPRIKANIRAVVLNVCLSVEQATFLSQWAPAVIGTTDTIPDAVAIGFTHGFYAGVGNHASAADCFEAGVAEAALASAPDAAHYTIAAATDPSSIVFV